MAKATKFEKLVRKADDAGKIRRYAVNPDVVALRVENSMKLITLLFWSGVVLGLAYTVPNVAHFMGGGFTGWFVSPAINAPLVALLLAHSIMARYDEKPSWQVQWGKFLLLAFEYGMNTWAAWAAGIGGTGGADEIFKHSVPMVIVAFCAEGVTDLRGGLTRCVAKAYKMAADAKAEIVETIPVSAPPAAEIAPEPVVIPEPAPVVEIEPEPVVIPEPEPTTESAPEPVAVKANAYRPEGGTRAEKLAADIATLKAEYGDGVMFLAMAPAERMKAVKALFSTEDKTCGNSRAYRLADEFTKVVESELRSEIA